MLNLVGGGWRGVLRGLFVGFCVALFWVPSVLALAMVSSEDGVSLSLVAEGLEGPADLAFGPDGSLYYAELAGGLRVIRPGQSSPEPDALWTPSNLQTGGERGFVGLALDPDFAETRAFYVFYVVNESGAISNRLSRVVDGVETVLLGGLKSEIMHNSGRITFLPDKTMLVSTGDAIIDTAGPQKSMHAHDETDLAGKILRVDRDGKALADNPFGNEVWTKGHRNVYGIAVSPEGMVIGTENGPEKSDEINLIVAGNDYGWPTCKGACDKPGFVDPVLEYTPTIAPTGATWFKGHFYFSDFNSGRIHRVYPQDDGSWADIRVIRLDSPRILDVEAGPDALYFGTWDSIYRVTVADSWMSGEAQPYVTPAPTPTPTPTPSTSPPPSGSTPEVAEGSGIPFPSPVLVVGLVVFVGIALRRQKVH